MVSHNLQIQELQCSMCETIVGRRLVKTGNELVKSDFCCDECFSSTFFILEEAQLEEKGRLWKLRDKNADNNIHAQRMRATVRYNLDLINYSISED